MKVPGSVSKDVLQARAQEARNDKIAQRKDGAAAAVDAGSDAGLSAALEDSMQFSSLGALLKSELNPAKMADERRAKIEALKEQIKNGTYRPPVEGVAQALSEEVSLEVLLSGGALKKAE